MNEPNQQQKPEKPRGSRINMYWIYGLLLVGLIIIQFIPFTHSSRLISFEEFDRNMLQAGDVDKLVVVNREYVKVFIKPERLSDPKYKDVATTPFNTTNPGPHYRFKILSVDDFTRKLEASQNKLREKDPSYQDVQIYPEESMDWSSILSVLIPIVIVVAIWIFIMRRMAGGIGGAGGQIFNFGKSKATLFDKGQKVNITFADVAGLDEAKAEVMEIVDFLKNPRKYTALGGKIPKGALLIGPPGTGKTLIAKAVAGEAQVPFFSISGSDFVELFVGVGASRVRDLFRQAREKAPCIIFIDEIDAIGRARGRNMFTGGNDERENTLNQLLVEMDGFGTDSGVIILAATNRPDVLDSALLRPGRFDRQISIDKPDLKGREMIFQVHLKNIKVAPGLDISRLASQTPGFAGADIANVCNEAALIAARKNKKLVEMSDFQDAIDRVVGGLEKKNKIISEEEKRIVAYHEAGHAICGWFLEHADPLVKVSIVPRGVAALGYAQYLPKEQYLYTREQLNDQMCMALGGRAAEEIVFGKISTGAQNDLERITKMAYAMVAIYGMNDKLGNVSFYDPQQEYTFQKPYSEETAKLIDEEVRNLIHQAYERTRQLLTEKRESLERLAQALLQKEILFQHDIEELIGKRPYEIRHAGDSHTESPVQELADDGNGLTRDNGQPQMQPVHDQQE
ncbi:MAG: ATP-dependent zinc metalloprotease FtsH [Chitinophagales bacterium]|nr:ATP-dependent zinc metalloprotease FtsH [Chitinophagales bacterium]MDW8393044.1 ATP-dependent zinc metalloprotease FtsH [Chitinophagales bacterium]